MTSYGMFSEAGNLKVAAIVEVARNLDITWPEVMGMLRTLASSDYRLFGEATDTAVREAVYEALLLTTDFYDEN